MRARARPNAHQLRNSGRSVQLIDSTDPRPGQGDAPLIRVVSSDRARDYFSAPAVRPRSKNFWNAK